MGVGKFYGTHLHDLGSRSPSYRSRTDLLSETFFSTNFFIKFQMRFSLIEHSICHILGMVGPIDVNQNENDSTEC